MDLPKIQYTLFDPKDHERSIEQAITMEFCEENEGNLIYIGSQAFLQKELILHPLAISHTKGLHLISLGKFGIDTENMNRVPSLKPEWIPAELNNLEPLEIFTFGESVLKLNICHLADLIKEIKIIDIEYSDTKEYLKIHSQIYLFIVETYFFKWKNFLICISKIA